MPGKIRIPIYAKVAAKEGLKLRREVPKSKKFGLTEKEADKKGITSGVERARQIINNIYLTEDDAKDVARFYMRFKNCRTEKCEGAIGLWGGRKFGKDLFNRFYGGE